MPQKRKKISKKGKPEIKIFEENGANLLPNRGRNLTISSASFEFRTFQGRQHLVAPCILMVEGAIRAMNADDFELALASEFNKVFQGFNGRPVVVNHPILNGAPVSANIPEVLEGEAIGMLFNAKPLERKLSAEIWVDVNHARALGDRQSEMVDRLEAGETIELSIGIYSDIEPVRGTYNGKEFNGIWRNIVPDHLALLEEGRVGACSVEDGCGTMRANCGADCHCERCIMAQDKEERPEPGMLSRTLSRLFRRNAELSDVEKRNKIYAALAEENKKSDSYIYVVAVYEDYFVFEEDDQLYRRSVSFENDVITLEDDSQPVEMKTEFVLKDNEGEEDPSPPTPKEEEPTVEKEAKVNALIANEGTKFGEADKTWLLTLEDEQLDKLEPVAPVEDPETPPVSEAAPADPAEPRVNEGLPEDLQKLLTSEGGADVIREGIAMRNNRRNDLVKALTDAKAGEFTEAELRAMSLPLLEKVAKAAKVTDYGASPLPRSRANEDASAPPAPPSVADFRTNIQAA